MNDILNDKNLQEAVSRREQRLEPMPAELNERLMQRIAEKAIDEQPKEEQPKAKRKTLWIYGGAVAAVAAGILCLLLVDFGHVQQEPEPLMAQQTTAEPLVAQSQPINDEPMPEVETSGQPSQQQAEEPAAEAEPQAVEPAPSDDGERQHHYNPQAIPDISSPRDEILLTSTSGMSTRRGYHDGLAANAAHEETEAEADNSKNSVPEGWKDLKSWSNDHKLNRDLTKKERRQMAILNAIEDKHWHIDIQSMNTMRYGSRTVTTDFFLELRGDTLRSYLPYLGQAQASPSLSPSVGLNFEEPVRQYKESRPKGKYTQIDIDVKTREDSYHYVIELYDSGSASIRVRSLNRDPISFDGTIEFEP